jgi:hypothetical protein
MCHVITPSLSAFTHIPHIRALRSTVHRCTAKTTMCCSTNRAVSVPPSRKLHRDRCAQCATASCPRRREFHCGPPPPAEPSPQSQRRVSVSCVHMREAVCSQSASIGIRERDVEHVQRCKQTAPCVLFRKSALTNNGKMKAGPKAKKTKKRDSSMVRSLCTYCIVFSRTDSNNPGSITSIPTRDMLFLSFLFRFTRWVFKVCKVRVKLTACKVRVKSV